MPMIALVVQIDLHAGRRADFVARALRHRELVLANEPGCHRFDVLEAEEAPDRVFLYEVYADEAALEHHFGTDYMKRYLDDTAPMIRERRRNRCVLVSG